MAILNSFIKTGLVPQSVVRLGLRKLLRYRLEQELEANVAQASVRLMAFVDQLKTSPNVILAGQYGVVSKQYTGDFFQIVLGDYRKLSCCYWGPETASLTEAEAESFALVCRRAELGEEMRVLDLGCGWGSLSYWIGEKYPSCHVVAVAFSAYEANYIKQECRRRRIDHIVDVQLVKEPSDLEALGEFDRIFAIESLFSWENLEKELESVSKCLSSNGRFFAQVRCHRDQAYQLSSPNSDDWTSDHFITARIMPSDALLLYFQKDMLVTDHWRLSGMHYAKTARAWLENLLAYRPEVMSVLRDSFGNEAGTDFEKWKLFFITCEELFSARKGNEWWVAQYLFKKRGS